MKRKQFNETKMKRKIRDDEEKSNQDCLKHLSVTEKILFFLLILITTICVTLFIYTASLLMETKTNCQTSDCIKSAATFLETAGNFSSTNPCNDFYTFVCGNFLVEAEENNEISPLNKQLAIINHQKHFSLTQDDVPRTFYEACINSTNESEVIWNLLEEIGEWPLLLGQNWIGKFDWVEFTIKLRNLGLPSDWFIKFVLDEDEINGNRLKITAPSFPTAILSNQTYLEAMVKLSVELGGSKIIAINEMTKIRNFEEDLIKSKLAGGDDNFVEITLSELAALYPKVPWIELLGNYSKGITNFTENTTVIWNIDRYLLELDLLLIRTPRRTHANYFVWKLLEYFLPLFRETFRLEYFNPNNLERSDYCWEETYKRFNKIVDATYLKKYSQNKNFEAIKKVVDYNKDQLIIQLTNIPWISVKLKKYGIKKIRNLQVLLGETEEEILSEENTNNFIENFTNGSQLLFNVTRELLKVDKDNLFLGVSQNFSRNITGEIYLKASLSDQIFFDWDGNIAIIPVPLIQDFWYNYNRPNYLNYAALGSIVAQQLAQELIKLLIEFPEENTNRTSEIFSHLLNYDKENAEKSLEEEFADIFGLNLAYLAYQEWIQNNGVEQKLPGLDYSPEQLFWVQATYLHCSEESSSMQIFERLQSAPNFSKDFNCILRSKMNPAADFLIQNSYN